MKCTSAVVVGRKRKHVLLIMVDNTSGEQTVYQYFTIISDEDSFNGEADAADYTIFNNVDNEKEEEDQEVMYLLEPMSSDVVLNSTLTNDASEATEDVEYNYDPLVCPKIELVLEDGQMYMRDNSLEDVQENYTFDREFIGIPQEEGTEIDMSVQVDEVAENETELGSAELASSEVVTTLNADAEEDADDASSEGINFWKVQLVDGSCAIINNSLLNNLMENMKSDEKPKSAPEQEKISCSYFGCGKVYTSMHHLMVHWRSHTGHRPYQCAFADCKKAFSTAYSLKAHLRTHTGEAPYGCTECPKHFKTSGDLQKHLRTHTGEKPFVCPVEGCGRAFTTSNIRKVHVRSHTGERPYRCTHQNCNKAFASVTNFKNHMRIHSGEKPYKCPVPGCGKRFTEYSSLFKHNAVHKPFTPIKCEYCDLFFKHEGTLWAHKQSAHKILLTDDGTEVQLKKESDGNYVLCSSERILVRK